MLRPSIALSNQKSRPFLSSSCAWRAWSASSETKKKEKKLRQIQLIIKSFGAQRVKSKQTLNSFVSPILRYISCVSDIWILLIVLRYFLSLSLKTGIELVSSRWRVDSVGILIYFLFLILFCFLAISLSLFHTKDNTNSLNSLGLVKETSLQLFHYCLRLLFIVFALSDEIHHRCNRPPDVFSDIFES